MTAGYMDREVAPVMDSDVPAAMRTHGDILTWSNTPQVCCTNYTHLTTTTIDTGHASNAIHQS